MATRRNSLVHKIKVGDVRMPFVTAQGMTAGVSVRVIRLRPYSFLGQDYCDYLVQSGDAEVWVTNLAHLSRPADGRVDA